MSERVSKSQPILFEKNYILGIRWPRQLPARYTGDARRNLWFLSISQVMVVGRIGYQDHSQLESRESDVLRDFTRPIPQPNRLLNLHQPTCLFRTGLFAYACSYLYSYSDFLTILYRADIGFMYGVYDSWLGLYQWLG